MMVKTRTNRQTRTSLGNFQTRSEGNEKRIEGYFVVFNSDYELWPGATESVDAGAFDGGTLNGDVRCLIDHDTRLVLGRTTAGTLELRKDNHGIWGSVLINEQDSDAMNLYSRVQRGDVNQCSFGFDILDEDVDIRADGSAHWTIKAVELYEVSCVTFPAYKETEVQARKDDWQNIQRRKVDEFKARMLEKLKKRSDPKC